MHDLRRGNGEAAGIGLAASDGALGMSRVTTPAKPDAQKSDRIELVCASGHRSAHSLARLLRLNDGWCGTCGADISYEPGPAEQTVPARQSTDVLSLVQKGVGAVRG